MKDYYLNVTNAKVSAFKNELPQKIRDAFDDKYYQDENIIIDWIGRVPNTFNEDGSIATYKQGQFFNVRVLNPEWEIKVENFVNSTKVNWVIPFRMFGTDEII